MTRPNHRAGGRSLAAARAMTAASLLTAALLAVALLAAPAALGAQAVVPVAPAACRANALAGVYHPWRLHVIEPCLTVSGFVQRVRTEPDRDWHINLKLDPGSPDLVNAENRWYEHGDLIVEVIPMDQPEIARPHRGEHITLTGAYVLDADHGWTEIHPAWIVDGEGATAFTAQAAQASVQTGINGNRGYFGD